MLISFSFKLKRNVPSLDMLTMSISGNSHTEFDRRSTSLVNGTSSSSTIKQQPFSPPPYHSLSNAIFTQHHQRTTPSPDHEQISPLSNSFVETSSASNLVPPSAIGGGW